MNDETERLLEQGAVLLELDGPVVPTEYGKRWLDDTWTAIERDRSVLLDVAKLAESEAQMWDEIDEILRAENALTAISSGTSQYAMAKLIDHLNGKTAFTMPGTVAMALATAAPTSTTTGSTLAEATYTGYGRQTLAGSAFNAATAATPSVATNVGTITFGNCTAGTNTLLGFILADSATAAAGNALWYGTLTSVTISTTQTPPTVGAGVMNLSMTGV